MLASKSATIGGMCNTADGSRQPGRTAGTGTLNYACLIPLHKSNNCS